MQKRLHFYYIDFYDNGQKECAREIAAQMEAEREQINALYNGHLSNTGDRERMRLFLFWPSAYAEIDKIYDNVIVPIKQKRRESNPKKNGF